MQNVQMDFAAPYSEFSELGLADTGSRNPSKAGTLAGKLSIQIT